MKELLIYRLGVAALFVAGKLFHQNQVNKLANRQVYMSDRHSCHILYCSHGFGPGSDLYNGTPQLEPSWDH